MERPTCHRKTLGQNTKNAVGIQFTSSNAYISPSCASRLCGFQNKRHHYLKVPFPSKHSKKTNVRTPTGSSIAVHAIGLARSFQIYTFVKPQDIKCFPFTPPTCPYSGAGCQLKRQCSRHIRYGLWKPWTFIHSPEEIQHNLAFSIPGMEHPQGYVAYW